MRKCKWVIYTVIIGLIPIFLRIIMCLFSLNKDWEQLISPVDVAFFGLTLNLTNFKRVKWRNRTDSKRKINIYWLFCYLHCYTVSDCWCIILCGTNKRIHC